MFPPVSLLACQRPTNWHGPGKNPMNYFFFKGGTNYFYFPNIVGIFFFILLSISQERLVRCKTHIMGYNILQFIDNYQTTSFSLYVSIFRARHTCVGLFSHGGGILSTVSPCCYVFPVQKNPDHHFINQWIARKTKKKILIKDSRTHGFQWLNSWPISKGWTH